MLVQDVASFQDFLSLRDEFCYTSEIHVEAKVIREFILHCVLSQEAH